MSRFLCCLFLLLASPAGAEIVVRQGDYYPELRNTGESVRITGGRIDNLVGFGGTPTVTIEGGSIGTIRSGGNLVLNFRGGGFRIDNPILPDDGPMADSDATTVNFEGVYSLNAVWADSNRWEYAAWFNDFSYGEFVVTSDLAFCTPNENSDTFPFSCNPPAIDSSYITRFPGDTQGDGVVNLADMNNVRNFFGDDTSGDGWQSDATGDGLIDLADLNSVRNNFGADYTVSNPVPEPSTTMLLLAGMTGLLLARSWRCNTSRDERRSPAMNS